MMATKGTIRIGTSGWSYKHWVGPFYPEGTRTDAYLSWYCRQFRTVELNNTFYSLPKPESLDAWASQTHADFRFACKASRYITHMKKLKDPDASTRKFFDAIAGLGEKCGPVLFQLPPNWHCDTSRLAEFLRGLPPGYRYAFEFRDETWFDPVVYDLLAHHDAALVIYDLGGVQSPCHATASFTYLRLHGPRETPYTGSYDTAVLEGWANRLRDWRDGGVDVYCYFDNDEAGYAALNAGELQDFI